MENIPKWNFDTDTVTRDITLYAQWKQHQWGAEEYAWRKNGCIAIQKCGQCDALRETEVSVELTTEELRMSHVPDDLQLLIAGYTLDGKMIGCQLEDAAEIVAISIHGNAEDMAQICVFFVNADWEPLRIPMK